MSLAAGSAVAIVGIGCRFPGGANSSEAFWDLLVRGEEAIGPMPPGRFDSERMLASEPRTPGRIATRDGGFLPEVDRFDASFFGISPREARKMDPQQRLLLEVTWEALADAGIPADSLAGRRAGVYVGLWSSEYEQVMARHLDDVDLYATTGGGRYAASGRISYALDVRGPSLTVDTACSSSLVALHLACRALQAGEAEIAVAGAANLILQPFISVGYSRSGMLSPQARCRFGSPDPDGYVRSEGGAVLILKRLEDALRDRDPVQAVVLGSSVNSDGRGSDLLVAPSADAQAAMLREAYADAKVDPAQVLYVEAHGTGTQAGDAAELSALGKVLGAGRGRPLPVGSVKRLIGHTEAASGFAGLIKAVLSLQAGVVPGGRHDGERNPSIPWTELNIEVPTGEIPLDASPDKRLVGVNSFGVTGTNAHVVLAAPPLPASERSAPRAGAPMAVALSAATEEALSDSAASLRAWIEGGKPKGGLADVSYTTTCRREHLPHRMVVLGTDFPEVVRGLEEELAGQGSSAVVRGAQPVARPPHVAFVFSGQGSQWLGMGQELIDNAPEFTDAIDRCDALIREMTGWSLRDALSGKVSEALERVDLVQPILTCVQIALAEQLRAWGVVPQAVVGHSMGEVAAAYIAGALPLEDALEVIVARSRLLAGIAGAGAMALVDLPEEELAQILAESGGSVSIASVNGPRSTVMSGSPAEVDALLERLDDEGVFCRRVRVDVASHSVQTEPLLEPLRSALAPIDPKAPEVAFYSTARPEAASDSMLDAGYWVDNLRQPVQLMAAVRRMIADSVDTFVEIAPHPVLLSSLADIAADAGAVAEVRTHGGPRRDESERYHLLHLLARLHVAGAPIRWDRLAAADARVVRLPHYPWQRERHWLDRWEDWSGEERTTDAAPRPDEVDTLTYTVEWEPAAAAAASVGGAGEWLLVENESGLAVACAEALRSAGAACRVVASAAELPATLRQLSAAGGKTAGVVTFPSPAPHSPRTAEDDASITGAAGAALAVMRALVNAGVSAPTWWVTRGVQTLPGRPGSVESWAQAGVWGLARTLWQEHPELDAHLLDLELESEGAQAAAQVVAALTAYRDEPQLAFANETARAPRLRPAAKEMVATAASWRADGAYLVTGGLGALGLRVAEALVRRGARRLILLGRTPLPPRREWGDLTPGPVAKRIEAVRRLESLGAAVHLAAVDAGDAAALGAWVQEYRAESWPSIRGIIHCAGALDNRLLRDLPESSLAALMGGKAAAAANLGQLIPEAERTIYFSSTVAVLPQAGQGNYAAANAALDALAAARTAAGQPTVSLGWGVWKGEGLVADARVGRYVESMEEAGLGSLDPEVAISLFHWMAGASAPHLVLAPIDWSVAGSRLEGRPGAAFYHELLASRRTTTPGETFRGQLGSVSGVERPALLIEHLRTQVARILDVAPESLAPAQPLGRQGLDSLMALELRNRLEGDLQLRLPASLTWNYPTLERLSDHLLERLDAEVHPDGPPIQEDPSETLLAVQALTDDREVQLVAEIVELSESEILQQLRSEV